MFVAIFHKPLGQEKCIKNFAPKTTFGLLHCSSLNVKEEKDTLVSGNEKYFRRVQSSLERVHKNLRNETPSMFSHESHIL